MRTLRIFTFLLIATCAFAIEKPREQAPVPPRDFASDFRTAGAPWAHTFHLAPRMDNMRVIDPEANTCYFIRSYIMKREGEAGATHLDHVTTCTPKSRIRMKTKVK